METIAIVVITLGALVSVGVLLSKAMKGTHGGCACGFESCCTAYQCMDQANDEAACTDHGDSTKV